MRIQPFWTQTTVRVWQGEWHYRAVGKLSVLIQWKPETHRSCVGAEVGMWQEPSTSRMALGIPRNWHALRQASWPMPKSHRRVTVEKCGERGAKTHGLCCDLQVIFPRQGALLSDRLSCDVSTSRDYIWRNMGHFSWADQILKILGHPAARIQMISCCDAHGLKVWWIWSTIEAFAHIPQSFQLHFWRDRCSSQAPWLQESRLQLHVTSCERAKIKASSGSLFPGFESFTTFWNSLKFPFSKLAALHFVMVRSRWTICTAFAYSKKTCWVLWVSPATTWRHQDGSRCVRAATVCNYAYCAYELLTGQGSTISFELFWLIWEVEELPVPIVEPLVSWFGITACRVGQQDSRTGPIVRE